MIGIGIKIIKYNNYLHMLRENTTSIMKIKIG